MKSYEINLPYYKKGDDLGYALQETDSIVNAFKLHAKMLGAAQEQLLAIADVVAKYPEDEIEVQADTHFISLDGPKAMIKELLDLGLISEYDYA